MITSRRIVPLTNWIRQSVLTWVDLSDQRESVGTRYNFAVSAKPKKSRGTEALSRKIKRALTEVDKQPALSESVRLDWGDDAWEEPEPETEVLSAPKKTPAEVRCFDTANVHVKSGDGGNGCVAFHREKFVSKGGPSGGQGGRGGHVWAVVDRNLNSLLGFRKKVHYKAGKGGNGKGSNLTGAQGEDSFVAVPPGTVIRIKDENDTPPLAELFHHGDKALLAVGGKGGRGNCAFKTARNNAPTIAENGAPGEEMWLELELKLVADVGIIGVPNAGKSTFLAAISAAKPKIANYPFTTLIPNLGVCDYDYQTTVFADVPGLLEGASKGIGLGHEFLRHCMRCRVLVHVIDGTSPDPIGDYEAIQLELRMFSPDLASKSQIVIFNKMDVPEVRKSWEEMEMKLIAKGIPKENLLAVSAVSGENTKSVVRAVRGILKELPEESFTETDAMNLQKPIKFDTTPRIEDFTISVRTDCTPHLFTITGEAVELFTAMTNWNYYEAYRRFQRVLERSGINDAIREAGAQDGDEVQIGDRAFSWSDEHSDQELYRNFKITQKMEGRPVIGSARWPHGT